MNCLHTFLHFLSIYHSSLEFFESKSRPTHQTMMWISNTIAFAAAAFLVGPSVGRPLTATPGSATDIVITSQDTVNGTYTLSPAAGNSSFTAPIVDEVAKLNFAIINNVQGGALNAYVTGLDSNNKVVMLSPNGAFYYPVATGSSTPQLITANVAIPLGGYGSKTTFAIPDYISSARVWFAQGTLKFYAVQSATGETTIVQPASVNPKDPSANVNWGFIELTNTAAGGLYANVSFVDFVGLPNGISLQSSDGPVQTAVGLVSTAVSQICSDLIAQAAKDGQPWDQLCMKSSSGVPLRALAPTDYISANPSAFSSFWTSYVNDIWTHYSTNTLVIDTQSGAGKINCNVQGGLFQCAGDNRGYAKPAAIDIFGCNTGPFGKLPGDNDIHLAVIPRLCAAINRSTLLINGGNVQPSLSSTSYYTTSPTNHYSRIVHKYEVDGKGYAFAYDDVNPSGENQSGTVADPNPVLLTVTVGGPSS